MGGGGLERGERGQDVREGILYSINKKTKKNLNVNSSFVFWDGFIMEGHSLPHCCCSSKSQTGLAFCGSLVAMGNVSPV